MPPAPMNQEETTAVMPVIILPSVPPIGNPPQVTRSSPSVGPQAAPRLVQATEALRLADHRFWGIRAEVRGNTVYLRGEVYRWEHLFELARAIARLRGVEHVVLEEVQAELP